jgi:hypothetical protein
VTPPGFENFKGDEIVARSGEIFQTRRTGPVTLHRPPFLSRLSALDNVIHDDRHFIVWRSLAPIFDLFRRNCAQVRARDFA